MARYVETRELYNKVARLETLFSYVAEGCTYTMKPDTLKQYEDMLEMLKNSEHMLQSILAAQNSRHRSPVELNMSSPIQEVLSRPKEMMRIYRSRFSDLRFKQFSNDYIKDCASSLYEWFNMRFKSATESLFRYNPEKICNYIDQFIVAYGYYLREKSASEFEDDFYTWSKTVDTAGCVQYPLPKFILDVYEMPQGVVPEAVILENEIKNSLYDDNFYPDKLRSIYSMYHSEWPEHSESTIKMRSKI